MKNNKQRTDDWHSKRGTIIYYTRLIEDLISEGNVEKAQKLILELIDEYPDDYTLLMLQARIYIFEGKYDDAKKII